MASNVRASVPFKKKASVPHSKSAGGRLWQVVNTFRGLSTTAPSYVIQVFILVAMNPGITITEIANLTGIAQAQATRAVALMAEQTSHWKATQRDMETLGWIELYEDDHDARRTLCRLSKRGEAFWATLEFIIGKE